jgi:copper transport outer membrane protein MctB
VYNLRYHIASLVAVFLALAVGLLLGTIVVERGVITSAQRTTVQELQKDFNQIRSESAAVKKTNDALSAFVAESAPRLVESALTSRTVLVIAGPDTAETVATTGRAIRAAGGVTAVATFSGVGLSLGDEAVAAAAAKALDVPVESLDATAVVIALAREWSSPDEPRVLTKALIAAGGLKLTGLAATDKVGAVAVSATFDGTPDPVAFRLAAALSGPTVPAVGVETTKRSDGAAAAAKTAGLSGVDDVDSPIGQVSLVWVLSGRASGLYGVGEGVDGPYPTPLFPAQ